MVDLLERVIGSTVSVLTTKRSVKSRTSTSTANPAPPTWATVNTGWFSTDSLVPLAGSELTENDTLEIPIDKEVVKSAPRLDAGDQISEAQQHELFRHYGVQKPTPDWYSGTGSGTERMLRGTETARGTEPITRSEERLDVGTESRPTGKARLRKYVVTETQSVEVPVTREEARIVHEPITDPSEVPSDIGDESREVTLHADEVQVTKQSVPVEKVRLEVDDIEDTRSVSESVRKERIESDSAESDSAESDSAESDSAER